MITRTFRDDIDGALLIVASLKVCAQHKDLHRGSNIHAEIARRGLSKDNVFVSNAVVNLYAKCGALVKAQEVFDGLSNRDVVSWNVLIAGYAQHAHGEDALTCFEGMRLQGIHPNIITLLSILKACISTGMMCRGEEIHAQIAQEGLLEIHIGVGNALVDMYSKCGSLAKAQDVFDRLPVRNVVSWNVLITGYIQYGHGETVLNCFEQMQLEGLSPDSVTFLCVLKACGIIGDSDMGQDAHAEIVRRGLLETEIEISNALIDMYAKYGALLKAQEVFDMLPVQNIVSWNSLIAGYAQQGYAETAVTYFELMQLAGLSPNVVTFVCIMKACVGVGMADKCQKIHAHVVKAGLLEKDNVVGTALVDMYAKCGALQRAQEVFDKLLFRSGASWNALIAGYVEHEHSGKALHCFEHMQTEGLSPDAATFLYILKACGNLGAANKGREIHAEIAKEGLLETDIVVANALVDMYAKCSLLGKAREVFDKLPVRNVVSWNALIAGHVEHGHAEEALNCFECMQLKGISVDVVTFVYILKACGSIGALEKGQEIHTWIVREDLSENDMVVGTALVDMYVDCGMLAEAQAVFDMSVRDEVSWNVLVAGFAQHLQGEKALNCFKQMQNEGFQPNAITIVSILKACASLGAAYKGQEVHAEIVRVGLLVEKDTVVGTALVDMYANCGMLDKAAEVFEKLLVRDGVSWSALITGYAQLGKDEVVLDLFNRMIGDCKAPDFVTFTVVLNTCSHTGLIDEGQMYFQTMNIGYGIIPTLEHYTCIVDLFGRAGSVEKAVAIIKEMPFSANSMVWHNLLGSCQKHGNVELGRLAFEHATQLDEKDVLAFVAMRNIYTAAGRQEDANKNEALWLRTGTESWSNAGVPVDEAM